VQNGTYAIYLRKSREDIESEKYGEGETLARHEKILTTLAEKRNLHISKIYREVVSGETISERKEMQKLLKDVENEKWTGVLVVEVERLARGDTADQGRVAKAFKYSHTKIITPVKTYDPDNEFDEEYHKLASYYKLSDSSFWILYELYQNKNGCTQKELYTDWYLNKQTINSSVKYLINKKYIMVEYLDNNKKSKIVKI